MAEHPHVTTEHPQWADRTVTLICGPPGAGKTTLALTLHPRTLDIGELPPGTPRERMRAFGKQAWHIGRSSVDIAVVRGAPTPDDRDKLEQLVHPCRTIIMLTPADVCHQRINLRNRDGIDGRDLDGQHAAVDNWWTSWYNHAP